MLLPRLVDSYFLPNGGLRLIERTGSPLDQDGRPTDRVGNWSSNPPVSDYVLAGVRPGPDYADNLPTSDSAALIKALRGPKEACGDYPGGCMLDEVQSIYATYLPSPTTRSALWVALAEEPSITYLGRTVDRLGRDAEVFSALDYDGKYQLLAFADPNTGAWLGSETILIRPVEGAGFDPPAVTQFTGIEFSRREPNRPEHSEAPVIEVG